MVGRSGAFIDAVITFINHNAKFNWYRLEQADNGCVIKNLYQWNFSNCIVWLIYYLPQTKLREGNVFTGREGKDGYLWSHVLSGGEWVFLVPGPLYPGGWLCPGRACTHPLGWVCPGSVGTHLHQRWVCPDGWVLNPQEWALSPPGGGYSPPPTTAYRQQAGGTHPTGMLSC